MSSFGRKIVFGTLVGTALNRMSWKKCALGELWCNARNLRGPTPFTTCWGKPYLDAIYCASSYSFLTARVFP